MDIDVFWGYTMHCYKNLKGDKYMTILIYLFRFKWDKNVHCMIAIKVEEVILLANLLRYESDIYNIEYTLIGR